MTSALKAKKIRAPGGYWAYVPLALPVAIDWTDELVQALSLADSWLGRLNGASNSLPNPHLFTGLFSRKEAVLSSKIEGTQVSLSDILLQERGRIVAEKKADTKEVLNYIKALDYGIKRLNSLPLSMRLLNEIHEILMSNTRGHQAISGGPRKTQNWIGRPGCTLNTATYVPPPVNEMHAVLSNLEKYLHLEGIPPLIQISTAHYQFEAIHPYLDGNGRLGRLLIILFTIERKLLDEPILYLSAYFERHRQDYYDQLLSVSKKGSWIDWHLFFLDGVVEEAQSVLQKIDQIEELLERWQTQLSKTSYGLHHQTIFNLLENPFLTAKQLVKEHDVAFTTAQRAISRLEKAKIVRPIDKSKRDKIFVASELMRILEDPE